jgi:choline dehydrogenase-like flavoprotein
VSVEIATAPECLYWRPAMPLPNPAAPSDLDRTDRLGADVVVVGSGAGGAPVAAALSEAGLDVVLLEAGSRFSMRDFARDAGSLLPRLYRTAAADGGHAFHGGACVGGSTVVNDCLCWRPPSEVLSAWRQEHGLRGLDEAAFAPFVERVWNDIHAAPTTRTHLNRNAHRLEVGARRLGWSAEAMPRNVRDCANLGHCNFGCPTGAKQSTLLTYVPRAERSGCRVVADARVDRIDLRAGAVRGVDATRLDPSSRKPRAALRVDAPIVCVAAGVLETPGLLLRSGLGGRVGFDFQVHSTVYVTARFREPVHAYYGPTMAYAVSEWSDVNGHAGPGFMLENVAVQPITAASALPGFGAELEARMAALPHLARAAVLLRDRSRGRICLGRDGAAQISYDPSGEDRARLRDGMLAAARAYFAADAVEVYLPIQAAPALREESDLASFVDADLTPARLCNLYAVHLFGGAVMADAPDRGVCDEDGTCFGTSGLFVTDAAGLPSNTGVNPQVTIMANALRIAERVSARGARRT